MAHIYYNKGDLDTALDLCEQASKCVINVPQLNRVDTPLCMKANFYLEDNESEKAITTLNNLDRLLNLEDVYALLTRARVHYLKSVVNRHEPVEQSKRN